MVIGYNEQMPKKRNEISKAIDVYKKAASVSVSEIALRTTVAAIPYAGGSILELWGGIAQRRTQERLNAVFEEMKQQLDETAVEKINRAFFDSEEFQTLLYLLLEKLHVTHDHTKLKMFGDVLANSGRIEFQADDKESYVRVLRDLSVVDVETLNHDNLKGWTPAIRKIEYSPDVLSSLSRLVGFGLVNEKFHNPSMPTTGSNRLDGQIYLKDLLASPMRRAFHLAPFGERFLKFISAQDEKLRS